MTQTDQIKLIKAGFTILRRQNEPKPIIKMKSESNPYHWKRYEEFESKAARDRIMKEFLKKDKYVED